VNDKTKMNQSMFAEICDGLILLKITNFNKHVGSLANEIAKCSQIGTSKIQRGHKKRGPIKMLTFTIKSVSIS